MSFRYVSNSGEVIEFGEASPYYADADRLRAYEVGSTLIRNTVSRFSRDPATVSLPITISADTEAEGAALLDRLQQAFDHDVRNSTAGRLEVEGHYAKAFVTTLGFEADDSFGLFLIELDAKVLLPNPVWILESERSFSPSSGKGDAAGMNYPYNFPFNFCSGVLTRSVENPLSWPCAARITIYGPASSPYVYIGDNRYQVDVDVPEGGLLIIDGLDKSKIELRDRYGGVENVFDRRISGALGSGSYVFEPVPSGVSAVTWDGSFAFDLCLCGERSWPPCTT